MKNNCGFTLTGLMFIIGIVFGVAFVLAAVFADKSNDGTICIGGYKFIKHSKQQIIGQNGGGVPCDQPPNNSKPTPK